MTDSKTRVVVLGGGVGGMTTAFQLTATQELRDRYDVTVYQMGWRLGGKGASGRNMERNARIEEHGLHIWFGFYDNAFAMMRRCYEELDRPKSAPLATLDDAFKPASQIVLCEHYDGEWRLWPFDTPRNPLEIGTVGLMPTLWDMLVDGLELAARGLEALEREFAHLFHQKYVPEHWPRLIDEVGEAIGERIDAAEVAAYGSMLAAARRLAMDLARHGRRGTNHHLFARLITEFKDALWHHVVEAHVDNDYLRIFFTTFDTVSTIVVGLITDDVLGHGFDSINDLELKEWLNKHGAHSLTLEQGALLRAWYDAAFAYEYGHKSKPNMAAGTAVHGLIRIMGTYKGAISWKMQAGMGDTIFAPLYEVLKARGVRFEFFHRVTNLGLNVDRDSIGSIDMMQQIEIDGDGEYQPFVPVKGLPCWPNEPLWSQLKHGNIAHVEGINFEYGQDARHAKPVHLEAGRDFDMVVLAIPVAALPDICGELMANEKRPRFADMVEHVPTCMTQAFQLWMAKREKGLGWEYEKASILTSYHEPVDTFCDMHQLIKREEWEASEDVECIAYFCGVLADEPDETQDDATQRAYEHAHKFMLGHVGPLWPHSDRDDPVPGFDWDLLVDPFGGVGDERLQSQYWRANFQPTERYVQSYAGTIKYRLPADQSGYANLFLAGDWVRNGINGGCVEAAVMAGMQASRAICGEPAWIVGEDWAWLEKRDR